MANGQEEGRMAEMKKMLMAIEAEEKVLEHEFQGLKQQQDVMLNDRVNMEMEIKKLEGFKLKMTV